jgi:hypothetical protein
VNLGFALTIWDQLSGRAVFPTNETIRIDTGLPGRPLTVEQSAPRARHFSVLVAQLVGPFRPLNQREKGDDDSSTDVNPDVAAVTSDGLRSNVIDSFDVNSVGQIR